MFFTSTPQFKCFVEIAYTDKIKAFTGAWRWWPGHVGIILKEIKTRINTFCNKNIFLTPIYKVR